MKHERSPKKTLKADLILLGALLLFAGALFLLRCALRKSGAEVCVYIDGVKTASYDLSKDQEVELFDEDDQVLNRFVIKDGACDMTDATCPDEICVHMHPIRYQGESITCLPHRTVLQVEGGSTPGVDIH